MLSLLDILSYLTYIWYSLACRIPNFTTCIERRLLGDYFQKLMSLPSSNKSMFRSARKPFKNDSDNYIVNRLAYFPAQKYVGFAWKLSFLQFWITSLESAQQTKNIDLNCYVINHQLFGWFTLFYVIFRTQIRRFYLCNSIYIVCSISWR